MSGGDLKKADNADDDDCVTPLTSASTSPSLGPSISTKPSSSSLGDYSPGCLRSLHEEGDLGSDPGRHLLEDEASTTTTTTTDTVDDGQEAGDVVATMISPGGGGGWRTMPASRKARRTRNPIRAIMDPIMADARTTGGGRRHDGKGQISLAVSSALGRPLRRCDSRYTYLS